MNCVSNVFPWEIRGVITHSALCSFLGSPLLIDISESKENPFPPFTYCHTVRICEVKAQAVTHAHVLAVMSCARMSHYHGSKEQLLCRRQCLEFVANYVETLETNVFVAAPFLAVTASARSCTRAKSGALTREL